MSVEHPLPIELGESRRAHRLAGLQDLRRAAEPIVVYGAGEAGRRLVSELHNSPEGQTRYHPVAMLDDDPALAGVSIEGLVVHGDRSWLADVVGRFGPRTIVVAIAAVCGSTMRELIDDASSLGVRVLVLPGTQELYGRTARPRDIRPMRVEDLVRRLTLDLDESALDELIAGRTVLITGAGGYLGGELARQAARFGASRLVLLDHDEAAISTVLVDLRGRRLGHAESAVAVLADVTDETAVRAAFERYQPQVVFHAAGLRDVETLQRNPAQAWRTDVMGTLNILTAAENVSALLVANVSTVEADEPVHAFGYSKRIAERLTAGFDTRLPGRYVSVRVSSLVGSARCVLPVFQAQIGHGGPITVPRDHARRRFMLAPEAAQLTIQASALAVGGEVMGLDVRPDVPLLDVARAMCQLDGRQEVEVVVTGTRWDDDLTTPGPSTRMIDSSPTWHRLIRSAQVSPISVDIEQARDASVVTPALLRYLALGLDESAGASESLRSEPDWDQIEREWAAVADVERPPSDAFTATLADLEYAVARQGSDAARIVDNLESTRPHPDATDSGRAQVEHSGGADEMTPIYLSKADVGPLEEKWVLKAVRSGYVAPLGPMVDEFERRVAERCGVSHALALSSGTAALHLLLLHVGARPGTFVILPTMTFAATVNAVRYTGATPYFVDVQASDANIDVDLMLRAIDGLQARGEEVAAVVTVDLYGRCCDYTRIEPALESRGVPLIEDAAEALGASHRERPAGSFGLGAALSFNGNKIMTTSGGGMLLSNDGNVIERARYLSTQARLPVPWYEHEEVGYNYRLSNILAGLGIAQLSRLDEFIARRRQIRDIYAELASRLPGARLLGRDAQTSDAADNCWLTSLVCGHLTLEENVDGIVSRLGQDRIEVRHLWKPLHAMPAYAESPAELTGVAAELFRTGVNLPSGAGLTDDEVERVVGAVDEGRVVRPNVLRR